MSGEVVSRGAVRTESRIYRNTSTRAARAVDQIAASLGITKPTVFVSGFWRSGTTWMQELLAGTLRAKTVFEPLCPQNALWRNHLISLGVTEWDYQESYIPGRRDDDDPMWRYLDLIVPAVTSTRTSIRCRSSIRESFRRAIVVKDVRLQLNLEPIHRRYGLPIVHVRRHPCAVVSSLLQAKWPWSFERLRLDGLTAPFRADLRRAGLADADWFVRFDNDGVSRMAAFWAITERLAERSLRDQPWARIVSYEKAVFDPDGAVDDICRLIGQRPLEIRNVDLESATTQGSSRGTPAKQRPHAWRSRLDKADADRVCEVVGAIFPEALDDVREDRGLVSA